MNLWIRPLYDILFAIFRPATSVQTKFLMQCYHQGSLDTCGSYSVDTKDVNLEILHFKQFYKHFVFEKDEEGYVKKTQKKLHGRKSSFATGMRKHKKYN